MHAIPNRFLIYPSTHCSFKHTFTSALPPHSIPNYRSITHFIFYLSFIPSNALINPTLFTHFHHPIQICNPPSHIQLLFLHQLFIHIPQTSFIHIYFYSPTLVTPPIHSSIIYICIVFNPEFTHPKYTHESSKKTYTIL